MAQGCRETHISCSNPSSGVVMETEKGQGVALLWCLECWGGERVPLPARGDLMGHVVVMPRLQPRHNALQRDAKSQLPLWMLGSCPC